MVYTVSELTSRIKELLETEIGLVSVEGEVSNIARPASGHIYFTLKDRESVIRAVLFRSRLRNIISMPEEGKVFVVCGYISVYEARGEYQIYVEGMELKGLGELWRKFEVRKKLLMEKGLFDESHKKKLPPYPETIGVITSISGAAIRDILHVTGRRYPYARVIIYPVTVQGTMAAMEVCEAIKAFNEIHKKGITSVDVLIIARGGGSLEDLWAFNEEQVAYAIYNSDIPVVTGVGHETDFTIADFVADVRAPTPSGAAEVAVPDRVEVAKYIGFLNARIIGFLQDKIAQAKSRFKAVLDRHVLGEPERMLFPHAQHLDDLQGRLMVSMSLVISKKREQFGRMHICLERLQPDAIVYDCKDRLKSLCQRLLMWRQKMLTRCWNEVQMKKKQLSSLDPKAVLVRGYCICKRAKDGQIVRDAKVVEAGENVEIIPSKGVMLCRVEQVED